MNTLNRLKFALGLINNPPKRKKILLSSNYQVQFDEKFCVLSPKTPTATITLENKMKVGYNAAIFRFNFPNENLILGTKIAKADSATITDENTKKEQKISRSFVPISGIDEMGIVDFLVRIYRPDETTKFQGGLFSNLLDKMRINDKIEVSGPITSFIYNGMGSFDLPKSNNEFRTIKGIRYLGLVASGNGITAFFQLLETLARSRIDKTNVSLLYINREYRDILLLEELVSFHEQKKLHLNLMLEHITRKPETYWPGLSGEVTPEILKDILPPPGPETLVAICVAKEKKDGMKKILNQLGYTDQMIFMT